MTDQSELMRRAEELSLDIQAAIKCEANDIDRELLDKALPYAIMVHLLLKGTTAEFKESIDG